MKDISPGLIKLVKTAGLIVAILFGLWLLYQIYKWWQKEKNRLLFANSTATTTVGGTPISINLGSIAQQIYSAFHEYYYGMAEDEEAAIVALLNVPKSLIPQLTSIYSQAYDGKDLNHEFINYLSKSDYQRVSLLLN